MWHDVAKTQHGRSMAQRSVDCQAGKFMEALNAIIKEGTDPHHMGQPEWFRLVGLLDW